MPRNTRHEVTGILLTQGSTIVLEVDGGGTWRLDEGWRTQRLLGMRVRVTGVRDGFDLLTVKTVERV